MLLICRAIGSVIAMLFADGEAPETRPNREDGGGLVWSGLQKREESDRSYIGIDDLAEDGLPCGYGRIG